jgi:hypothetical protein
MPRESGGKEVTLILTGGNLAGIMEEVTFTISYIHDKSVKWVLSVPLALVHIPEKSLYILDEVITALSTTSR